MVALKHKLSYLDNGQVDLPLWLAEIKVIPHLHDFALIEQAGYFARDASKGLTTFYGQPCLEQGLEMARIIVDLKLDAEAVTAAILLSTFQHTKLKLDTFATTFTPGVAKLIQSVRQMDAIHSLQRSKTRDHVQIDRYR